MGLDTVEIVLWAEEEFNVEMPDEEVGNLYTVGEFSTYITKKVNESMNDNIEHDVVFLKLLDVLESDYGVDKSKVKFESRFIQDLGFG